LQALVTLNDSVYVEAAHRLALNMQQKSKEVQQQIAIGYEQAIGQPITSEKLAVLEKLYHQALTEYQRSNQKLVSYHKQHDQQLPQTKALALVASAILNLDEFVTKN
jgi:hypothetical protein